MGARAVMPEIRLDEMTTLSLGEDRSILSSRWVVNVNRAGVCKLSFALPDGFDVEAISSAELSHWTELQDGAERVVTLHLSRKVMGKFAIAVDLAGPSINSSGEIPVPRLQLREAAKQRGQLTVIPEQGMRLHLKSWEGVAQRDPKEVGIRKKGALIFRILQKDWTLFFDLERLDPWVQSQSLQDVTVREGMLEVNARFVFDVQNAGVRSFHVQLPADAVGVAFKGDSVSGFKQSESTAGEWEVTMDRRVIGDYSLGVHYHRIFQDQPATIE